VRPRIPVLWAGAFRVMKPDADSPASLRRPLATPAAAVGVAFAPGFSRIMRASGVMQTDDVLSASPRRRSQGGPPQADRWIW